MDSYSHSKLDILRKCFLQYKYKYIDKLEAEKDTIATDFGEVCHLISEHYTGSGKVELLKLYKNLVPEKYKLIEKYVHKVPLALKNIHAYNTKILKHKDVVEVNNELNLKTQLTEEIEINGKIDVLIKYKNGRYKVVDYKTSKAKRNDYTNQLAMYKLLIHTNYNIPYDQMDAEIVYLALDGETKYGEIVLNEGVENIISTYNIEETDIYCLISEIEHLHKCVKTSLDKNDWSCKPTWFNCTYCDYKNKCDKRFIKT